MHESDFDKINRRLTKDEYWLLQTCCVKLRATCLRRQVGCILVDAKSQLLASGYNGVPRNFPHCGDKHSTCHGHGYTSGTELDKCQALHAEQNALKQCFDVDRIHTAYVSSEPCASCAKMLLNTSVKRVVFLEHYPAPEVRNLLAYCNKIGRRITWAHFQITDAMRSAAADLLVIPTKSR